MQLTMQRHMQGLVHPPLTRRALGLVALALVATACSQQDKKPRLPERAVVGSWRSDTLRGAGSTARVYQLQMLPSGLAEFTSDSIGKGVTTQRGTWDGADSLVRVVVRGDGAGARPASILFAIRKNELGLVRFDSTAWGPQGLTLYRK